MNNISFGKLHIAGSYTERAENSAKKAMAKFCGGNENVQDKLLDTLQIIDKETGDDDFRLCCNGGIDYRFALQQNFTQKEGGSIKHERNVISRLFELKIKPNATPQEKIEFLDTFTKIFRDDKTSGTYAIDRVIREYNDYKNSSLNITRTPQAIENLSEYVEDEPTVMSELEAFFRLVSEYAEADDIKVEINPLANNEGLTLVIKRMENGKLQAGGQTYYLKNGDGSISDKVANIAQLRYDILEDGIFPTKKQSDFCAKLDKYTSQS